MLNATDVGELRELARSIPRVLASARNDQAKRDTLVSIANVLAAGLELLAEQVPAAPTQQARLRVALAAIGDVPGVAALRRELGRVNSATRALGDTPPATASALDLALAVLANSEHPAAERVGAARLLVQSAQNGVKNAESMKWS